MSWQYLAGSGGNNIPAWHDGGDATPYSPVATAIDRPIFTAGDCMPIFRVAVRACPKEYRTRRAGSGARKHAGRGLPHLARVGLVLLQRQVALGVVAHHEVAQLFIAERIGLFSQFLERLPVFLGGDECLALARLVALALPCPHLPVPPHSAARHANNPGTHIL